MWQRLCSGLLVLAMVASGATASHAHLHTANGHRVADDPDHAGDPAQPLWHAHAAAHAHDTDAHEPAPSSPDDAGNHEHPEDVVSLGGPVASSPSTAAWVSPVLVAIVVARSTLDVPIRTWIAAVGALPPVHAPPLIGPRSPRAPPTFVCLSV